MNLTWQTATDWGRALLAAAGLSPEAAEAVVETLVYAERRGFTSHGFIRLPTYAPRIRAGGINGHAQVHVVSERAGLAIVDADRAAGAFSAVTCVDLALAKAATAGAAVVIARNANHFGAAGYYTDRMAAAGFLGIALANSDAIMCAPFGGRAVLGSNPIAIAVPIGDGSVGPHLDMATSEGNYGKILLARDRGEQIPTGWAVDATGAQTLDPAQALAGALLPSGGPKGFGLAFMIDCIAAISGAQTSNSAGQLYGDPAVGQDLGHVFIAIAVDGAQTPADYAARVDALSTAVHDSALPGSRRPPLVPGEPEQQRFAETLTWAPEPTTLDALRALSRELAVDVPST